MAVTEEQVRLALEQVIDPELFVNIVDLGLVYKVEITEAGERPPGESAAAPEAATPAPAATEASAPAATAGQENGGVAAPIANSSGAEAASAAPTAGEASNAPATGGADVLIEMTMTSPACPAGPELLGRSKMVTSALAGVRSVDVKLVMTPPWSPDRMTEAARDQLGIF